MTHRKTVKEFRYEGLGFPLILTNVPMVKVRGSWTPEVDYNQLQKSALVALCIRPFPLTGNEIAFIRRYFDLTLVQLSQHVRSVARHLRCSSAPGECTKWLAEGGAHSQSYGRREKPDRWCAPASWMRVRGLATDLSGVSHVAVLNWERSGDRAAKQTPSTELCLRLLVLDLLKVNDRIFRSTFQQYAWQAIADCQKARDTETTEKTLSLDLARGFEEQSLDQNVGD